MARSPLIEATATLSPDEVQRYGRHITIPEVGLTGQRRLATARVVCIGAGGLGSATLMYLAAAGIGTLGVVEFDTVEASNLQRQIIHRQSDIGRLKAESARDAIAEINPNVDVVLHAERLDSSNALTILADYDLVIDGTDNFATRYLVNDACVMLGKPYVWGSIYRFEGQASVFWAQEGPCYRCVFPEPPPPGSVPSCAEGGVLGVLCASMGSVQVTEAVKLLLGIGDPLIGRMLTYDALAMRYRELAMRKDPDCVLCGAHPTVTSLIDYEVFCGTVPTEPEPNVTGSTISVTQLHDWLDERERGERDFVLVDVREPSEVEIVTIAGSVLMPKGGFVNGSALADLPRDRQVVLYCRSGVRSAQALTVLHGAGFNDAVHLGGGVLAWVAEIERHLPTY